MTFPELEAENAKLRADLAECRQHFVESTTKLGTAAALADFPSDGTVKQITAAIQQMRLAIYHKGFDAGVAHEQGPRR